MNAELERKRNLFVLLAALIAAVGAPAAAIITLARPSCLVDDEEPDSPQDSDGRGSGAGGEDSHDWYCTCYRRRDGGWTHAATSCRRTLEQCRKLDGAILRGSSIIVAGSGGPSCSKISSDDARFEITGWTNSSYEGALQHKTRCLAPGGATGAADLSKPADDLVADWERQGGDAYVFQLASDCSRDEAMRHAEKLRQRGWPTAILQKRTLWVTLAGLFQSKTAAEEWLPEAKKLIGEGGFVRRFAAFCTEYERLEPAVYRCLSEPQIGPCQ